MEKKMPKDFYWGGSVSSFQTEGARNEGGKGVCIYDVRPMNPEFSDWNVAIDEYHRYDEDIALMKEMGFNFYRFSICWSRIIPNGTLDEPVNEEGVKFYNELIDKLKKFNTSIAFVGDGAIAYRNKLEQALGQDLSNSTEIDLNNNLEVSSTLSTYFFEEEKNLASSISIARFAYNKYVNSNDATKDYNSSLSPMYLRKSQAERSLEEKQERQGE